MILGVLHFLRSLILALDAFRSRQLYTRGEDVCYRDQVLKANQEFCFIAKPSNSICFNSTYKLTKGRRWCDSKYGPVMWAGGWSPDSWEKQTLPLPYLPVRDEDGAAEKLPGGKSGCWLLTSWAVWEQRKEGDFIMSLCRKREVGPFLVL